RFHPALSVDRLLWNDLVLFVPERLMLETTSLEMPKPLAAFQSASPVLTDSALTILINRTDEHGADVPFDRETLNAWDNIGAVDVQYQTFVWSGRPLPPFPLDVDPDEPPVGADA